MAAKQPLSAFSLSTLIGLMLVCSFVLYKNTSPQESLDDHLGRQVDFYGWPYLWYYKVSGEPTKKTLLQMAGVSRSDGFEQMSKALAAHKQKMELYVNKVNTIHTSKKSLIAWNVAWTLGLMLIVIILGRFAFKRKAA